MRKGFTLIELITVIAISALLLSIFIPSIHTVRKIARIAKQKVQINVIDQSLLVWRNDFGDYPPSNWNPEEPLYYCGSQKLTEALLGRDLLGFHPKSFFLYDGFYSGNDLYPSNPSELNIKERKKAYITIDAFMIKNLFQEYWKLHPDTYVICDVFIRNKIKIGKKIKKAGMPLLYYKANPSSVQFGGNPLNSIYNSFDNFHIIFAAQLNNTIKHPLAEGNGEYFYNEEYKILDSKIINRPWPHRPDSYILISAGPDGLYGTNDDITNF